VGRQGRTERQGTQTTKTETKEPQPSPRPSTKGPNTPAWTGNDNARAKPQGTGIDHATERTTTKGNPAEHKQDQEAKQEQTGATTPEKIRGVAAPSFSSQLL